MPAATTYRPRMPVDVVATLAPLCRGSGDPCQRRLPDGSLWRSFRTPAGPATVRFRAAGDGSVAVSAWGPGQDWAIGQAPDLLGRSDDPGGFRPTHAAVLAAHRRLPFLRIGRCALVFEMLVPAILEQRVTGGEARRAWRLLVGWHGEPAPGPAPAGMRVCPPPRTWARVPSWDWRRAGVDDHRARTVLAAATVAARLEEAITLPAAEALARLRQVPGVGAWTAAEVAQRAFGDPDAVSIGDYHIPAMVGWALSGRPVDDSGMMELLRPYAPQRQRVVRLLEAAGFQAPRFGPRAPVRHRRG